MKNIRELCSLIRTKNAGPYEIGLDLIFKNNEIYKKVKDSKQIDENLIPDYITSPKRT